MYQKTTIHINSVFNCLWSSPLLKPHTLFQRRLRWWKHSWSYFLGIASSCLDAFSWNSSMPWNFVSFKWDLIFGKGKIVASGGWSLGNMLVVGPKECCAWPKPAAQGALNGQVCCHGGIITHLTHANLSFTDEQHSANAETRYGSTSCLLSDQV